MEPVPDHVDDSLPRAIFPGIDDTNEHSPREIRERELKQVRF